MSENATIFLRPDVDLKRIFARLPSEVMAITTPDEIIAEGIVTFYYGPTPKDFIEMYLISKESWDYQEERNLGTFQKSDLTEPIMIAVAYRSFEALQKLLRQLLPDENGLFLDMDRGARRIDMGVIEARHRADGSLY